MSLLKKKKAASICRAESWFDCLILLQQGRYVADVAYFIGEDAPKMTGVCDPALPKGYSFDYINGDVLKERISVKDGMLVLPNGITYRMLVLPKLETMRPELLLKIQSLVSQGAVVFGPSPVYSPSLQNMVQADAQVKNAAAALWGNINGKTITTNHYGKGLVIDGMPLQDALTMIKALPDCKIVGDDAALFIHRKVEGDDVYFISNQKDKPINFTAALQVTGKKPELWDAVTGTNRLLPDYTVANNTTTIPLMLEANGSAFIVLRLKDEGVHTATEASNFAIPTSIEEIKTPWQVQFDTSGRGPAKSVTFNKLTDWTVSANDAIKYYSGTAVYQNTFTITALKKGEPVMLDLGKLTAMAKVTINGKEVGGVWTAPYELDISNAVRQGSNTIDIAVTNTWVNRLIGDQHLPAKDRKTWLNVNPYNADSPLEPSGLLGPVLIKK